MKDREAWCAAVHEVTNVGHDLETEQQQQFYISTGKGMINLQVK